MKKSILLIALLQISIICFSQSITITGDQYHLYGPNSTWGEYLKVGGNGRGTTNASVVATNGNLHLDSKDGNALYLNHYSIGNTYINPQGGNVGIGTSSPSAILDITRNHNNSTILEISNNNTGTLARRGISVGNGSSGSSAFLLSTSPNYNQVATWANAGVLGTDSQLLNGLVLRTSSGKIRFQPAGTTDKIVFSEDGKIGVGTTSPNASLHIKNNIADVPGTLIVQGKQNSNIGNSAELILSTESSSANTSSGSQSGRKSLIRATATSNWGQFPRLGFFTSNNINEYPSERMVISPTGSVGIGTISPSSVLHVKSNVPDIPGTLIVQGKQNSNAGNAAEIILSTESSGANTTSGSQTGRKSLIRATATSTWGRDRRIGFFTSNSTENYPIEQMVISPSGNVGIGTTNPSTKLHVEGNGSTYNRISNSAGNTRLTFGAVTERNIIYSQDYNGGPQILKLQVDNENNFVIEESGNIGIGTDNPSQKLEVAGTVRSREVKVEIAAGTGPDYVFEPDYDLRTLEETKEYITENKHLPEIPPAKEMEANGVDLGDMNMLLLKKIEELTLYQIDLLEKVKAQQEQLEVQQKEINVLKQKVN